jgi:hypothetical protein
MPSVRCGVAVMKKPIGCIRSDGVANSAVRNNPKSCGSIIHALSIFLQLEEDSN